MTNHIHYYDAERGWHFNVPNYVKPVQGWQCPVCGQVYGPHVGACFKQHPVGYSTTTNKVTINAPAASTASALARIIIDKLNEIHDYYHSEEEEE